LESCAGAEGGCLVSSRGLIPCDLYLGSHFSNNLASGKDYEG
jgi:hypothetical protein